MFCTCLSDQREPDVWMPLRMFCYIAVIWDNLRKKTKSRAKSVKIPFIYPLVISNASKPYTHSLSLRDMIEPEEAKVLFDEMFKNPLQLVDLAIIPDEAMREQLQNHLRAQALLLSLKHVFDDNLQWFMENVLLHSFRALDAMGSGDDVADLLYYLYNEGNLTDQNNFFTFLHQQFSKDVEEKVMTLGQQAVHQAMQQGARKQAEESAICLLKNNLSIDVIVEATKLSQKDVIHLANKIKKGH